ncbi:hypothetical protein BKA70DRAFT_1269594 [Coprinopsis sp. MPI-PUGE-AT-0042]|nr:hypothetical protein BKA70DRAFT_1269594 [Coprinopsis sp. MPI-PUGE-AT-0042]
MPEKLIAQASEIGLSVLSKASLFWKEGKEKVQKEAESLRRRGRGPTERRPAAASTFRDDHDDHEESSAFNEAPPPAARPSRPQQPEAPTPEEPKAYRHLRPPAPPRRTPAAPKPKPKRHLPFCPTSTISRVQQHKTKGTDAVAADEYTKAITLLPSNHLLLVPLQTNRAIAYIRCGECKSAIEDAGGALAIIGSIQGQGSWESWHPTDEEGGWDLESGSGGASEADGRGGYTLTRAKGSEWTDSWGRGEGLEKWKEAKKDWEGTCRRRWWRLGCFQYETGSCQGPGKVQEDYRRWRLNPETQAETETTLSKDNVEEKLQAWKKGKESNLRALLASLDTILGKRLSAGGVKEVLNVNNSTVEQRMIAGGVFGALNEAWLAFKP